MTDQERIATLLSALEEALDMADKYMTIWEREYGETGVREDWKLLKGFAESERARLSEREEDKP